MPSFVAKAPLPHVHQGLLHEESKKRSLLRYPETGSYLELDVWIPKKLICFEFQDTYHYISTWYAQRSLHSIQNNDKHFITLQKGISLIVVPCWWDGEKESLEATIHFHRPDLLSSSLSSFSSDLVIPLNPPLGFFPTHEVNGVGELMLASFPVDPNFSNVIPPNSWWAGEKYDGVRFCWNASHNTIYTKTGRTLTLRPSIYSSLPSTTFIDGELWFGRGLFSFTHSLLKQSIEDVYWNMFRITSFDIPSKNLQKSTFETRYSFLLENIQPNNPCCIVVPRVLCQNSTHLNQFTTGIIDESGEGVILRKYNSFYEHGRSPNLVKLKTAYADKEGLVVDVENGNVKLKLPNGHFMTVESPNVHVDTKKLKKGDIVSFSYWIHARRDIPVHAEIYRIRNDLSWNDVIFSSASEPKRFLNVDSTTQQLEGYWTIERMRDFMENFAKGFDLDPLLPHSWYSIPLEAVNASKSAREILQKLKGYSNALLKLFPNIGLDRNALPQQSGITVTGTSSSACWNTTTKRRKFFENFAKENEFDHRDPLAWYRVPRSDIMSVKGAKRVIMYHNGSVAKALIDLFPEIGFKRNQFWIKPYDVRDRRHFFEKYAKDNQFDPLVAENWYLQARKQILSTKGAHQVISYHRDSASRALVELFPDIGLDIRKLYIRPNMNTNTHIEAQKSFFLKYAKDNNFDPAIPSNWYLQSKAKIMATKGAGSVLKHHKNSVSQALIDLFPQIKFDSSHFRGLSYLSNATARREFFEQYAKENGFDPLMPHNWLSVSQQQITSRMGGSRVLYYHKYNLKKALVELFPEVTL